MGPQGTVRNNSAMPGAPQGQVPLRPQAMMDQSPNNQDLNPLNMMEQPAGGGKIDGAPNQYMFGEDVMPDVSPRMGYVSGQVGNSGLRPDMSGRQGLNMAADGLPPTPSEMYVQMEGNYFMEEAQKAVMRNAPDGMAPSEIGAMGFIGSPANVGGMPEPPARMEELPTQGMPSTDFSSPDPMALAPGNNPIQLNSPNQRRKGKK